MAKIYNKKNNNLIMELNEEQVEFLIECLEEEGIEDVDYFIDVDVVDYLEENAVSDSEKDLVQKLKNEVQKGDGEITIVLEK